MIDNVVAALGLGLNLTDEEIADVLWLAVQMQQFSDGLISERGDRNESSENKVESKEPKKPLEPSPRLTDLDRPVDNKKEEPNVEVHSKNNRSDDASTGRSDELELRIPDARSLQKPLELARSLRPLMRRVPSHLNTLLDEEATVRRIAEEKIWVPVLRPALEPWLDLALVIDESASMLMWKHTIAELGHFLSSYGVFRDVRIWKLGTDKAHKACIYAGVSANSENSAPRSPSELIEANGRCLVLVVSDCIDPIWHNGSMIPALQTWARGGMVAILQMLPDWLWGRTALNRGVVAKFSALTAGVPNYQLTTTTVSTWYDINLETCVKIPVVTLEPEKFTAWAEMLAGKGGAWSAGIVFEPEVFSEPEPAIAMEVASELDAEDRVHLFRLTASPIARRLAGLLAAAPSISLPIVRILQSKVLTQSQPVHVAEVFLGGLLKPLSEVTTKTNPNYLQYDFMEGVRDLLLESVPSSEIINVVAEVSDFIASRLGVSLEEFAAVIRNPRQVENMEVANQTRPFALLTAQILRNLGSEYSQFIEEVEQIYPANKENPINNFDAQEFYLGIIENIMYKTEKGLLDVKELLLERSRQLKTKGELMPEQTETPLHPKEASVIEEYREELTRYNEDLEIYKRAKRVFNERQNSIDSAEKKRFALEQDCYEEISKYLLRIDISKDPSGQLILTEPIVNLFRDLWHFEQSFLKGDRLESLNKLYETHFDAERFYEEQIQNILYKTEEGLQDVKISLLERSNELKQEGLSLPQQSGSPLTPQESLIIDKYHEKLNSYNHDLEVYNEAKRVFNDRKNSLDLSEKERFALEQDCYKEIEKQMLSIRVERYSDGRVYIPKPREPIVNLLRDLWRFEQSFLNGDCIESLNKLHETHFDAKRFYQDLIENIMYKTEEGLQDVKRSHLERGTHLKQNGSSNYNQDFEFYEEAERVFNDRKNSLEPVQRERFALEQDWYSQLAEYLLKFDIQRDPNGEVIIDSSYSQLISVLKIYAQVEFHFRRELSNEDFLRKLEDALLEIKRL